MTSDFTRIVCTNGSTGLAYFRNITLLPGRIVDWLDSLGVGRVAVRLAAGEWAALSFITILFLYPEKEGNRINPSLAD
jgi:hypothetical protein